MAGERRDNTLTGLGTERKPRFGRYQVVRKIGEGATSAIFVAKTDHPSGFEKVAALKVIRPELLEDPRRIETFLQEARLSARIDHANVCSVFDFGEDNGFYYIAMEYLVGETLAKIFETTRQQGLANQAATHRMFARVIGHACEGLHAAHELTDEAGKPLHVVHRDVCPDNIIVTYDGQVSVVDFGLARATLDDGDFDTLVSTDHLAYLAPEQARGHNVDRRADVWSLGAILWEGLAGRRLFDGKSRNEIVFQMAAQNIDPPGEGRWPVADVFSQCALRALSREVEERYADARTMGERLELALQATGNSIGASAISAWMHAVFPGQGERKKMFLSSAPPPFPDPQGHPLYDKDASEMKTALSPDTPPKRDEMTTRRRRMPAQTKVGTPEMVTTQTLDTRGMVAPNRKRRVTPEEEAFDDPDTSTFAGLGSNPPPDKAGDKAADKAAAENSAHDMTTVQRERLTQSLSQGLRPVPNVSAPKRSERGRDHSAGATAGVAQAQVRDTGSSAHAQVRNDAPGAATSGGRNMPLVPTDTEFEYPGAGPGSSKTLWLMFVVFVAVGAALALFRKDIQNMFAGEANKEDGLDAQAVIPPSEPAVAPETDAAADTDAAAQAADAALPDAMAASEAEVPTHVDKGDPSADVRKAPEQSSRVKTPKRSQSSDWIVDPNSSGEESGASKKRGAETEKDDWIVDPDSTEPEPNEPSTKPTTGEKKDAIDWIID